MSGMGNLAQPLTKNNLPRHQVVDMDKGVKTKVLHYVFLAFKKDFVRM